jgi:pyrroloquinoline quinone biosynthesis protein D
MAQPIDASRPRLASGCRLHINNNNNEAVMLFPEGALRLEGPSQLILEQCDGQRTFQEILGALQALYIGAGQTQMRKDVAGFLEQLQQQRIVDY